VCKPVQTGITVSATGDLAVVRKLAGPITTSELRRFPDRLPPDRAAGRFGTNGVSPAEIARVAAELQQEHELVLLEGTGGLLTRFDGSGATLADAAWALSAPLVLVADTTPDAVNTTTLSAEAATARGIDVAGVIVGRWPSEPDPAARGSLTDLPVAAGAPLLGVLHGGLGRVSGAEFVVEADMGLSPLLGGSFDAESFTSKLGTSLGPP